MGGGNEFSEYVILPRAYGSIQAGTRDVDFQEGLQYATELQFLLFAPFQPLPQ